MATQYSFGKIVTDGLVLSLDAADRNSYPGSGGTWFDLSTGRRNFTTGSGATWNPSGYFTCAAGAFTGPASNTFQFAANNEHTVECVCMTTNGGEGGESNAFLHFKSDASGERGIFSHLYYFNGNTYYDTGNQRIEYPNDSDLLNNIRHLTYRARTWATPNKQILKNTISQVDSGAGTVTFSTTYNSNAALLFGGWYGRVYLIRVYNRGLTDAEILQNYNATKTRFRL